MSIQIYIGTSQNDKDAELTLEYSIRQNTQAEVEIHWMRAGEPPFDWGERKTHTDFTPFRFCVPELAGYKGRAIYLDVDMLVLGDIAELWEWSTMGFPWLCPPRRNTPSHPDKVKWKTEVMVIDCGHPRVSHQIPALDQMSKRPHSASGMAKILHGCGLIADCLLDEWNVIDDVVSVAGSPAKLIHFSSMPTQPWRPHPDRFDYKQEHRCPDAVKLWREWFARAQSVDAGWREVSRG